jgi:hypothetical protein
MSTVLQLRYKYVYDLQTYFTFMINDKGRAGVLLCFKDMETFYQIEFSMKGIRFARMF